ncbi:Hypothetical protein A7982_01484 [Minicystis rosea]|nr:Hypothetical protein A7982_01484 [Minicystis rosea]
MASRSIDPFINRSIDDRFRTAYDDLMTITRGDQGEQRIAKIAGWGGIAFAILSGAVLILSPFWPPLGASSAEVVTYYRAHRLPFLIGNYLAILASVPSLAQLAYLTRLFKRAEGDEGWLWIAVLSAGVIAHAVAAVVLTVYQVIPFALDPGQEAVAKGLSDLAGVGFALVFLPMLAFVLATTWATYATGVLPHWYGHLGIPVSVICLIGSAGSIWAPPLLAGGGLISCVCVGVFVTWCFVLAILMLRGPATTTARPAHAH